VGLGAAKCAAPEAERQASYWDRVGDDVLCKLCPHRCRIAPGGSGLCKVRSNHDAALVLPYWGALSSVAIDPIEKKPLHHFMPGSRVFSVGFVGCNLRCPFCQNWEISQGTELGLRRATPLELVREAQNAGTPSIAYTYSEPVVHAEYLLEAMRAARGAGLRNVLVTNGCLEQSPAEQILALVDAVNVDLKCWSSGTYGKVLGGDFDAVLSFIKLAVGLCHVEVTTLVVPGLNDRVEDIHSIASFLAALSKDFVLHLSAYRPAWKYEEPPTSSATLRGMLRAAEKSLRYVYAGNAPGFPEDSRCPSCGCIVVRRRGYDVDARGLGPSAGDSKMARCLRCDGFLPIVL
jgi:pyruvate formate lyase activating enzyme